MGDVLLFGGLGTAIISQLYITVLAFRRSFREGVNCLIAPGYFVFWARRETGHTKALIVWGLGLVAYVVGVVVLS